MSTSTNPESKADAEALVPQFKLERVLKQDHNGSRISLLGSIQDKPALITLERASFPTDSNLINTLLASLTNTTNLGANDIYRWYMSNLSPATTYASTSPTPDLKLNLIYPCTPSHIKKYSTQHLRYVTETPEIYTNHIRPYMTRQRAQGRLDWVFNILEGRTEQEDVIFRDPPGPWQTHPVPASLPMTLSDDVDDTGFLLLPDLNWDRTTLSSLHLLALPRRRDIWSLRDLRPQHVPWLKSMRARVLAATTQISLFPKGSIEEDELKCYIHYQPTYYHFHIHVVHVMLESQGLTQSVGKAWGLDMVISWLESMKSSQQSMQNVDLGYFVGEESELWKKCFGPLKRGDRVDLND